MHRRHRVVTVLVVALVTFGVVACGDDDNSAKDQTCKARSDLSSAMNKVVDDVKDGNFGEARDDLSSVQSAASNLQTSAQNLAQDQRSEIQPDIDELQATMQSLSSATSLQDLQSTIDSAKGSIDQITSDVKNTLDC
jgi:predicted  nucleic acid-binding Zn-ribbon protein